MRQGIRVRPFSVFVLAVATVLLVGVSEDAEARRGRSVVIDGGVGWSDDSPPLSLQGDQSSQEICIQVPAQPLPQGCAFPRLVDFPLNIGGTFYSKMWVHENGFLSFGHLVTDAPMSYVPNLASLEPIQGNLVAPFYSDIATNIDCDPLVGCEVSLSYYPDGNEEEDDTITKGFRITWGIDPSTPNDNTAELIGVPRAGGDLTRLNRFQVQILDRADQGSPGDFDLLFNYDYLMWANDAGSASPTLIGFKLGPYRLEFNRYYTSFKGYSDGDNGPPALPADIPECDPDTAVLAAFSPGDPFVCNWITIRFRNGTPTLVDYTAGLTLTADQSATQRYSGEASSLKWTVNNAGPDASTHGKLMVTVPDGVSLVTASASGCTQNGTTIDCPLPTINAATSHEVNVPVTSSATGAVAMTAILTAAQWDPDESDNERPLNIDLLANADIRVDSCTGSTTLVEGDSFALSCQVTNLGPQVATDLQVAMTLPPFITFTSSSNCSASGGTLTCSAINLAVGANITFTVQARAASAGTGSLSAAVAGATAPVDRTASNNQGSATVTAAARPATPPPSPSSGGGGGGGALGALPLAVIGMLLMGRRRRSGAIG
jgi:MYXO-CTERM domain-containing protein